MTDRVSCALVARELGESLAGTAAETTGWIAVEHPGPWTPRAPTEAELGDVAGHLDVEGARVQLVRRVRHLHEPVAPTTGHTVLLGHAAVDPAQRWLEQLTVDRLADLADLDPTVVTRPSAPGIGDAVDHDVWLVCTHARRDACCALHGRPAALALDDAGIEVWETTHTGGHRFAATAVVLPDGLAFGRLDTVDVVEVAEQLAAGVLHPDLLRGRCAAARPAQAAEVALRHHLDERARDAVLPTRIDGERVHLSVDGATWTATVRSEDLDPARPVSDDADPTSPTDHVVTDLTKRGGSGTS